MDRIPPSGSNAANASSILLAPAPHDEPPPGPSAPAPLDVVVAASSGDTSNDVLLREVAPKSPLNLRFSFNFDERNELSVSHAIHYVVPPLWKHDDCMSNDTTSNAAVEGDDTSAHAPDLSHAAATRRKLKEGRTDGFGKSDTSQHVERQAASAPLQGDEGGESVGMVGASTFMLSSTTAPTTLQEEGNSSNCRDEQPTPPLHTSQHRNNLEASENGKNTNKASDECTNEDRNPATNKGAKQHVQDEPTIKLPEAISQNERDWIETTQPSSPLQDVVAPKNKDNTDAQQTARLRRPVAATKPPLEYTVDSVYPSKWEDDTAALVATARPRATPRPVKPRSKKQLSLGGPAAVHAHSATVPPTQSSIHQSKQQQLEHQLKALRETSNSDLAKLKVQLNCIASERDGLQARWERAVADMADMENQLLAYHIKVATAAAEREEFAQHCTSLQQTVVVAQAETDSHRKKLLAVQMDLHQAKAKCSVAEGKVETLTKAKVDAMGKLDAAKLTIGRWQASAESAKEKQHKLEVEVASLRNKRAADAKKLAQTVDQLTHHAATSMEKAVAQWTVDHATKVMSMQDQIDKAKRTAEDTTALLHRRNKALEAKLKQANDRVAILESKLRPLSHLTKRAKALEAVHSDNKRLQLELMAVHRQVAGKKAKSKPSHDYMDEQPSIVLSNNQFQHQHSPQTSEGVDTLQCELTRLQDKLAAQSYQMEQLRALHSQELLVQATIFQQQIARAT
ncbi:hypothetical protein, variant 1 [Aphanomyces astaci]|uniref:Uncharacterized protein n=1 Tax=Aphanomyces astaci TaxID=112090 RepID=W4GMN2_APHAT|nr:hypothetical protein, variant 1 [Aphanomyces astaci]ETV80148.1 hypothetical protein, variant 1 [Aphanomyces astaci]|eukprot:XP_009830072.1 hypothetical protein, variant 1 [Aphanomyces astaci]